MFFSPIFLPESVVFVSNQTPNITFLAREKMKFFYFSLFIHSLFSLLFFLYIYVRKQKTRSKRVPNDSCHEFTFAQEAVGWTRLFVQCLPSHFFSPISFARYWFCRPETTDQPFDDQLFLYTPHLPVNRFGLVEIRFATSFAKYPFNSIQFVRLQRDNKSSIQDNIIDWSASD